VADDDQAFEAAGGSVEQTGSAIYSDPVLELEPATPDSDINAVAGEDEDPVARDELGWARSQTRCTLVGIGPILRCRSPGTVDAVAGAICSGDAIMR
jgi:hypothetical protein